MQTHDLRTLIELLECSGELHRITVPVASRHELALITRRVSAFSGGGPALLFENVDGNPMPVLTNLFGSAERSSRMLGISSFDILPELMTQFLVNGGPEPCLVVTGPCREIIAESPVIDHLPVPVAWPDDGRPVHGGRFITLGQVVTREYGGTGRNLGLYRIACFTGSELGISWRSESGGAVHHAGWSAAGEQMPVAILLGTDPAVTLAAMTPLPPELDELLLAGALRGAAVPVCRALTSDLVIPARAEIVIEGLVDPVETRNEGAFGNYTGGYAGGGQVPVMRITAVTSRRNPILPALIAGLPPCENSHLAAVIARLMEPIIPGKRVGAKPWPSLFSSGANTPAPLNTLDWTQELEELVDRRWGEYGFSDGE